MKAVSVVFDLYRELFSALINLNVWTLTQDSIVYLISQLEREREMEKLISG